MQVLGVEMRDFRSYARAEAQLGDGLTVVHGPNGAGKSNLLEALYFGCTARSCRTSDGTAGDEQETEPSARPAPSTRTRSVPGSFSLGAISWSRRCS